jgi:hypothetical protein
MEVSIELCHQKKEDIDPEDEGSKPTTLAPI